MSMFPLLIEYQDFFSTDLNLERTITFYWLYVIANICSKLIICGYVYFNFIYLFYGYACIACMHHMVPIEARIGCGIPWD